MAKSKLAITAALASKILEIIDKGLCNGLGGVYTEDKSGKGKTVGKPGQMCVEAAVCYALGEEHGDHPSCVNHALAEFKIEMNDGQYWADDKARAKGLRRLAIAQLGTKSNGYKFSYAKFNKLRQKQIVEFNRRAAAEALKDEVQDYDLELESGFTLTLDIQEMTSEDLAECAVQALIEMKTPGSKFLYLTEKASSKKGGAKKAKKSK